MGRKLTSAQERKFDDEIVRHKTNQPCRINARNSGCEWIEPAADRIMRWQHQLLVMPLMRVLHMQGASLPCVVGRLQ